MSEHPVTILTQKMEWSKKYAARLAEWLRDPRNDGHDDWRYNWHQMHKALCRMRRLHVAILRVDRMIRNDPNFDYDAAIARVEGLKAWCNRTPGLNARRYATRHRCAAGVSARCVVDRSGKPRTKRCPGCAGDFVIERGLYGVFVWRGDSRYRTEDAIRLYVSPTTAQRFADANAERGYVVRWVAAETA